MNRGKTFVALAQNKPILEKKRVFKVNNDENLVEVQPKKKMHEDGQVLQQIQNETATSFDFDICDDMLSLIKQNDLKSSVNNKIGSNQSNVSTESDEDPFHETDYDDSDYDPNDDSDLNTTTQSTRAMAIVLESNLSDLDSPEVDNLELLDAPKTSKFKKINKTNKHLGKEYVTSMNKTIPAKKVNELKKCKSLCYKKINFEQQTKIFRSYWNLGDYSKRRQYLAGLIDVQPKKTATLLKASKPRNRQYNYLYHFEISGQRNRVCKSCFLNIFGESNQSVKTITKYKVDNEYDGPIPDDQRGKHQPHHKLDIRKHSEVLEHINSFPKYQSHYSRRHTSKVYFQSNLNIKQLYRLYTEKYSEPVSESKYREIFGQLDIKFKKPQLDVCTVCETFKVKIQNSSNDVEKADLLLQQRKHLEEADLAYQCKSDDKQISVDNKTVKMFSFDLQQCLPTPHLNASMFFYKRPLWTFNLTIHDGATNKANCYIWNETIAKRGANDIGSCIYKCLMGLPNTIKHVILYSDSCPGQNKNTYISAMFKKVLEDHPSIEVIDHKFLVVGHTHLECDTVHAQIEKRKKQCIGSVQHPHDWVTLISATNKKYIVYELQQHEFFDFHKLFQNKYKWINVNVSGEKFEWKFVRWMRYEKSKPEILLYKTSLQSEEDFKELKMNPKRQQDLCSTLNNSYEGPLNISSNKKKDLLSLLPLINPGFHAFYKNLKDGEECELEVDSDLDEVDAVN